MRVLRLGAVVAAATMIVALGACSSSKKASGTTTTTTTSTASGASATTAPSSADTSTIDIHEFMYQPNPVHVKAGATVTVTNQDGTNHSLTADNGSFDTGVFSGGSKTITIPTKPGTYTFHCQIHNFMKGTIVVS
jgi:plastocyanin